MLLELAGYRSFVSCKGFGDISRMDTVAAHVFNAVTFVLREVFKQFSPDLFIHTTMLQEVAFQRRINIMVVVKSACG